MDMIKLDVGEKSMTSREIADVFGISVKTIHSIGRRLFPNRMEHGKATHWTESEVTEISKEIKRTAGLGNSSLENVRKTTGNLNCQLQPKEIESNSTCDLKSQVSQLTNSKGNELIPNQHLLPSTQQEVLQRASEVIRDIASIIAELKAGQDTLANENAMLKHQVEYNATIGTTRWKDVKKLLGLHVNKEQMLSDTGLEENEDYFVKCMGYDKFPTMLLTDNAVSIIKETYNLL